MKVEMRHLAFNKQTTFSQSWKYEERKALPESVGDMYVVYSVCVFWDSVLVCVCHLCFISKSKSTYKREKEEIFSPIAFRSSKEYDQTDQMYYSTKHYFKWDFLSPRTCFFSYCKYPRSKM